MTCSPGTVAAGTLSTCTATVADTDTGTAITPTGTVSFGSSGPGSFGGSPCTLSQTSPGVASCSVSYTPGASGVPSRSDAITASYVHDTTHGQGPTGLEAREVLASSEPLDLALGCAGRQPLGGVSRWRLAVLRGR